MYRVGDFPLIMTEQEQMIVQVIRQFVESEIKPVRDKIDNDTDHELINEILRKLSGLGVFNVEIPEKGTPPPPGLRLSVVNYIIEEMAVGDVGLGIVTAINAWALAAARLAENIDVLKLFQALGEKVSPCLGCFAMTESASGCDIENLPQMRGRTIQTRAVEDGNEWVINGAKRFPSRDRKSVV
jgi:acyl-CoA dehydrogenase